MGAEHFDDRAATWDEDPDKVRHAREVAAAVSSRVAFDGSTRLLEYGAGTGLVSQDLVAGGLVGSLVVADSSSGMRAVLEQKAGDGSLPGDTTVLALDLEQEDAPEGLEVDAIVTSMVLHHVQDLDRVLTAFAGLLAGGGRLAVADLDREDGDFHRHLDDFHGLHGFDRDELTSRLERAGFSGVEVTDCSTIEKEGRPFTVFLATAHV